jgi:hypothetical protein
MIHLKSTLFRPLETGGITGLRKSLQKAIELEHATIPPYLYALYSLGTDPKNAAVASIIQSVVSEEMLHMTLACNILNAIGGEPVIDSPRFIPTYPGYLPGGVESGLKVKLEPFSIPVIKKTFMVIEEPEKAAHFVVRATLRAHARKTAPRKKTIGDFYRAIGARITQLGASIFTGDPARQVRPPFPQSELGNESFNGLVTDVNSALAAIDLIIDQGEGNEPAESPLEDGPGTGLSHYYRFAEIWKGRELVEDKSEPKGWSYSGNPLVADGPIANVKVKKAAQLPAGSAERHALDNFNYTYTGLLKGLHQLFNGFSRTLGTMMSLRQQALDMLLGTNLHKPIGPSFEYQSVNPAP